jgi:hypothetical protein
VAPADVCGRPRSRALPKPSSCEGPAVCVVCGRGPQAGETAGWIPRRRRLRVRTATSSPWLAPTRTGVRRLTAALRGRVLAASTSRGGPNAKRASGTDIRTSADCCSGQAMSRNGSGRSRRGSWARLLWANLSRSGRPWDPPPSSTTDECRSVAEHRSHRGRAHRRVRD